MKRGRFDEAEALLVSAAEALPSKAPPRIQLGLCCLANGRPEDAERALADACQADPENPAGFLFRALALADLERLDEAAEQLEVVRRLCPRNQILATAEAVLALRREQFEVALEKLGVSQEQPMGGELANSGSVLGRLVVELERRLLPLEMPELVRCGALPGEDPPAADEDLPRRGFMAQLIGLPASWKATGLQKKGLRKMDQALAHRGKEERYTLVDEALERFRQARELDPEAFRASFYLGEALLFGARLDPGKGYPKEQLCQARDYFYDAWRREGPNPYLFYYLGKASSLLGEVEAGADYFRRALERFEKLPEGHYGLGQCLLLMGKEAEARNSLLAAVQSDGLMARERLRELGELCRDKPDLLGVPLPVMPPEPEATPVESEPPPQPEVAPEEPQAPSEPRPPDPEADPEEVEPGTGA